LFSRHALKVRTVYNSTGKRKQPKEINLMAVKYIVNDVYNKTIFFYMVL